MEKPLILDPVYGIWYTPWWQTSFGCAVLVLIGVSCLMLVVYGIKKWYTTYALRPEVWAIKQLAQIRKNVTENRQSNEKAYVLVTAVLKGYLASRYSMPMQALTDTECLVLLEAQVHRSNEHAKNAFELLVTIIRRAQQVKFAASQCLIEQTQDDITNAMLFVDYTEHSLQKSQKIANKAELE